MRAYRPLPRRLTLRARLTLIYSGLFLIAGLVLLGTTYALFDRQIGGPGGLVGEAAGDRAPSSSPSPSPSPAVLPPGADPGVPDDQQVRLRESAVTALITQGSIALVVVGVAATGLGWLVAGRVLAPLHRVTDTAARIAAAPAADRGLHERIALRGPDDEVKDLADAFDTMVERLDRSFEGQRRFVANASHELRSPLALSRALIELVIRRTAGSADLQGLGEDLLLINGRHERLIGGLLVLAAAENEIPERFAVDLADVVTQVAEQVKTAAAAAGVEVRVTAGEAVTSGDAVLLERLVYNLVENGLRYNVPGGWVELASGPAGDPGSPSGSVEVVVSNTGPVVPPSDVPPLFEPFRRLGTDRQVGHQGAGLGLSIVRSVAHAHGGTVGARTREGGGLVVTVTLPSTTGPA